MHNRLSLTWKKKFHLTALSLKKDLAFLVGLPFVLTSHHSCSRCDVLRIEISLSFKRYSFLPLAL